MDRVMIRLAKNPRIGHWREELTDKRHRFFLVYSYLIVYRHETKPLQIIRVLHAAATCKAFLACRRANGSPERTVSSAWGQDWRHGATASRQAYTARSKSSSSVRGPSSRPGDICVMRTAQTFFSRSIQKNVL